MSVRAGIVVTGTEVLTGRVTDRNGPWLAERLLELGVDLQQISIVGDRPEDMLGALRALAGSGVDLIITSGGLGPTEDDLTTSVVASFQGREIFLDVELEARIAKILEGLVARWPGLNMDAIREGNRKQALVPVGAAVLEPVGTAPGVVVPPAEGTSGPVVVVLPGPPRELQPMWSAAVATPELSAVLGRAGEIREEMLRLFGIPESEIAETLRVARSSGVDIDALEITTCLRRGEVEVVTRFPPPLAPLYEAFAEVIRSRHADTLFSDDGRSVDQQVADLLREGGLTIAVCESCTGGLLSGRLTDLAGSSGYVLGGITAYSNEIKMALAGVPPEFIEQHGAVSEQVAEALAWGACSLGADVGVGVTGIAGPGGGTEDKPVGTVCFSVVGPGGRLTRTAQLPGARFDVRDRSTTVALHLVRRVLTGEGDAGLPAAT